MVNVSFTEPAEYDLIDIEHYIHVHLCNPIAAIHIVDGVMNKAHGLADYPKEHPYVSDELLGNIGIRMTVFDNYNIFYYYDEEMENVHVLRFPYNKADWKRILEQ